MSAETHLQVVALLRVDENAAHYSNTAIRQLDKRHRRLTRLPRNTRDHVTATRVNHE